MSTIRITGLPNDKPVELTLEEARLLAMYMGPNHVKSELEALLDEDPESDAGIMDFRVRSGDYLYLLNAVNAIRAEGEPRGDWLRELGALLHEHHA
jgi:hypothetical protein